jgi:hypothetical protein
VEILIGALAFVTTVLGTWLAARAYYLRHPRTPADDRAQLSVRISPTRDDPRQLALVRVHNPSREPENVTGWVCSYEGGRVESRDTYVMWAYQATLPATVQGQRDLEFLVDLTEFPWRTMRDFGVTDRDGRLHACEAATIQHFLCLAEPSRALDVKS